MGGGERIDSLLFRDDRNIKVPPHPIPVLI